MRVLSLVTLAFLLFIVPVQGQTVLGKVPWIGSIADSIKAGWTYSNDVGYHTMTSPGEGDVYMYDERAILISETHTFYRDNLTEILDAVTQFIWASKCEESFKRWLADKVMSSIVTDYVCPEQIPLASDRVRLDYTSTYHYDAVTRQYGFSYTIYLNESR